jgi:ABC-type phosphate/phosphonate transport system substrate-binding protein
VKTLVFANFMAPNMTSTYTEVAARVGQRLGMPAALVEGASLDQLRQASVDVAFVCGLPYVRLRREQPVLDEPRYGGRPVYFSDVIVRWDSRCRSFDDLRGGSWAHNVEDSHSGCLLSRYTLQEMGETEGFFGEVTFSGGHQESIRRVVDGEVNASAIDSHVLGVECRRNPDLHRQLRVIAVLGPSPIPPVIATASLPEMIAGRVRDALTELGDVPSSRAALGRGLIRRFIPIEDEAYDSMRRMLDVVERRPPPSIRVPA